MTLEEKISQMVYDAPAIERLGVPEYNWWNEGLHGLARAGLATVFPQAIGLASTWNPDLLHQVATAISDEARAKHHKALRHGVRKIYTGLTFWSPNINIFRDPRWGRGQETFGEDPYLTARMGVAFIKGLQGDDPHYLKLVATPKHYTVHSGPEKSRHAFDARISEREMRDFYLFAFEVCVKEGKAESIMGAYNRVNGEACCASHALLEIILRDEWGFEGYVVSDCWAIRDIFERHKIVNTPEEAAALALRSGCDLNCGNVYPSLRKAVKQGLVSETEIDRAVTRLFSARFRLGMFDPDHQVSYAQIPYEKVASPGHAHLALQAARESLVLLKNDRDALPLDKDIGSIAVIGPNAHDPHTLLGNYNGTPPSVVTPLEGIRAKVSPATQVHYAQGCEIVQGLPPLLPIPSDYLHPSKKGASEHGLRGSYFSGPNFKGKPPLVRVDREIDFIWKDSNPVGGEWGSEFSVRWDGYLVPPVSGPYKIGVNAFSEYRFFLDNKRVIESRSIHHPVRSTFDISLVAGKLYKIRLEVANKGLAPQAQLLWAPPKMDFEAEAVEAARKSDVVVLVLGLSAYLEGEELLLDPDLSGFDVGDRTSIQLPETQENLLKKISALGKPVVLVLINGSALAVNGANENVAAIIEAWYPGQAGGEAIADALFGDYNPGGKSPVTFYQSVDDLPPFDDYRLEGHTYRYFRGEPLFPFGYGLSYTTFGLENLQLDWHRVIAGESFTLRVDLVNTGSREGDEVIQVYARDLEASAPRPIKQLVGFQRVHLAHGEKRTSTFVLHANQFGFHNQDADFILEPGKIKLMVGTSSIDLPLETEIEITGEVCNIADDKVFFSEVSVA